MDLTLPGAAQDEFGRRFESLRLALADEAPDAPDRLAELAERALAQGLRPQAAAAAGVTILAEHLRCAAYRLSPRMLAVLRAAGPGAADDDPYGLLAWCGAAVAQDYGMLPEWPRADVPALMTRAQRATIDVALAFACAAGEVCERNGDDLAFASLRAHVATIDAKPGAAVFWRGHWAIVSAWHLCAFGRTAEARQCLEAAQALAGDRGLRELGVCLALQRARLVEWRDDPEEALALAGRAMTVGDPSTTPLWFADLADVRCIVAMRELDFHAAIGHARSAIGHLHAGGAWPAFGITYRANEAYALMGAGAPAEALQRLRALAALPLPDYLAARLHCLVDLAGLIAADPGGLPMATAHDALTSTLRQLRELEWPNVLALLPQHAARVFARALAGGVETDWVRAAIRNRRLPAPPGSPEAWPWAVKIRALGGFEVVTAAGPLAGGPAEGRKASGKPLELLRWLAVRGLEAAPVDTVAQALWPGDDREGRQKAFEVTAARLRRMLGSDVAVTIHDRRVRLNSEFVWVDVRAIGEWLSQGEQAATGSTAHRQAMNAALALYRGPCLADSAQPWASASAEALRARLAAALLRARRGSDDASTQAAEWVLRAVAADPAIASYVKDEAPPGIGSSAFR